MRKIIINRILSLLLVVVLSSITSLSQANNGRCTAYVGGSISHFCEKAWYGKDRLNYGWGGGAFIGGGYEFIFTSHWSLSSQLELAFNDNGAYLVNKEWDFYRNHYGWHDFLTLNIPIIPNFRFRLSDRIKLRFGTGPYLQEALNGRRYHQESDIKEKMHGSIARRFNVGILGEAAVETGSHLSYMVRVHYPFLKEGWIRKTLTLSAGVGYSF